MNKTHLLIHNDDVIGALVAYRADSECALGAKEQEAADAKLLSVLAEKLKPTDSDRVIQLLATSEWKLTKAIPWDSLTDEANAARAWFVERQQAPFCGDNGVRLWTGPSPMAAFETAHRDLRIPFPGAA